MNRKKGRIVLIIMLVIGVICGVLHQPFVDYLSSQAANPTGLVGSVMTRIWSNYFQNLSRWTFSLVPVDEYATILDVGFGGGANIKHIKERNRECVVYGVDISEEAVKTASRFNQKHVDAGEVMLSVGDVAYLPFADGFFDLVVTAQSHMYWVELEKGLSECCRVLARDGTLLISTEMEALAYHLPEYKNADDFAALLRAVGFGEAAVKASGNYLAFVCKK